MPDNPHSSDHGVAATVDRLDSTASSRSPTWLWQTTGALVGAIPGQLLLFLPVNQRIALSIAGALIGLMAFYEGIGLLRLLALSLFPLLGNGAVVVLDEVGVEQKKVSVRRQETRSKSGLRPLKGLADHGWCCSLW
ncbi:hypothetical protein Plim_0326 [Planctopirus limnophila DSM 3776]|uniref:Uncharacterized protein n=1 Tax=Planctopirus limnophila (strain ATCC 43296 / DSM 3776 / IFAM 1008 / Mu 290) TaxID=521674 RepID=D5SP22_PLAL2|nr:hypothetical protein [Planctopirus limnophila]ADG66177.1 hypothetical protein Plim_0326 [Planctopirus limnophila DSM 3776]